MELIKVVLLALMGWLRCNVLFKGSMRAFMELMLAGLAWLKPYRADASSIHHCDNSLTATKDSEAKGATMTVRMDCGNILTKRALKTGTDRGVTGCPKQTQQKVAREVVGECQRIAAAVVARAKTLETALQI